MITNKQANELAWKTRIHYDDMIERGFTPGQIAITCTMISVSQYMLEKGTGAGVSVLTACLNAVMSGEDIDITKIGGYQSEEIDVDFEPDGDWMEGDEEYKTDNVIHIDFNDKD